MINYNPILLPFFIQTSNRKSFRSRDLVIIQFIQKKDIKDSHMVKTRPTFFIVLLQFTNKIIINGIFISTFITGRSGYLVIIFNIFKHNMHSIMWQRLKKR